MQGHVGDPQVATVINGEAVGEIKDPGPPRLLKGPTAGEFEQRGGRDGSQIRINEDVFECK